MLTKRQLQGAGRRELEDLAVRVEDEPTRQAPRRCYRLEKVRCGKQNC